MILSKHSKEAVDTVNSLANTGIAPRDGIPQDKDPIWHEFLIGMKMIKAKRNNTQANLVPIAKSNLRLLNRQLENNRQYQYHVQNSKHGLQDPWIWSALNMDPDVEAGLLTFIDKNPLNFNANPVSNQSSYSQYGHVNNSLEGSLQMFLVVSGKISVKNISPLPSHNTTTNHEKSQVLKTGDVLFNNLSQSTLQTIRSLRPHSTLLTVHLPDNPHHTEYQGITRN